MDIHGVVQRSLNNSSNSGSGSGSPCARFVNGALDAFVDNCLPKLHDKIEFNISRTGDVGWRTASIVDIDEPRGCMIVIVEPDEASLYPAREIRQTLGFPQPNETHKYRWRPMGSALPYRTPMREARRHGDVLVRCSPCIMYLLFDTSLLDAPYVYVFFARHPHLRRRSRPRELAKPRVFPARSPPLPQKHKLSW